MTTQKQDITNGPSKFDLMVSLFEGKKITFTLNRVGVITVIISGMDATDEKRQDWDIRGCIVGGQVEGLRTLFTGYFASVTVRSNQTHSI